MKKFKRIICCLVFAMITTLILPNSIRALDNPEDLIKKIAPDGKNAVFKVKKPTNAIEGDILINGYVNHELQAEGYEIYAGCPEEPYTVCEVSIRSDDYDSKWENGKEIVVSGWKGEYTINVTYDEPKPNSTIDNYFGKLNNFDMFDPSPSTYYLIEDLSLINYYLTSEKSELWNPGAPSRALKFSTLNNVTNGSNVTYYLDVRAGMQDETLMFESAFGEMSLFYNGYSYGAKQEGLYLKRVIYIPQDTEDTKEAFVAAAQKRINDYLGNSNVVVSYGGLLSSLPEGSEDEGYPIESDGNYYNIKVGERTYKFYIVKGSNDQLVEPTYEGLNIESNIGVTSKDSSIPLDTSVSVEKVENDLIKNAVGTDVYAAYDISLYSDAKQAEITKLENGKFTVNIPVPETLKDKNVTVYYVTSEGEKEEHVATVKDGVATFETDHFSTYVIAEKKTESGNTEVDVPTVNPKEEVKEVTVGVEDAKKTEDILNESIKDDKVLGPLAEKAIQEGKNVNISAKPTLIDPTKVSAEVKKEIEKIIAETSKNDLTVAQYLDITIHVMADNEPLGNLTSTKEKLKFQIAVPEDLKKEGRTFIVFRIHDGKVEKLETVEKDGLLVFESDQFSTYALTYNDTGTSTPDTSDNSLIMSFIVLTVLSGLCLLVIKRKSELEK